MHGRVSCFARTLKCRLQTAPDARRVAQEDLCLMTTDAEGVLRFVSGAVLFPQRWSLLEKMGMDMRRAGCPCPRAALCSSASNVFFFRVFGSSCGWLQAPTNRDMVVHSWIISSHLTLHAVLLLRRIHDPVPIFNKEILKPVNAFMTRITPTKPFWRANWTVRHCCMFSVGFQLNPAR